MKGGRPVPDPLDRAVPSYPLCSFPWYARAFAACVVGYAFSPIDLIPDPIPVLGYLDDLILIPLGVALAIRMIPKDVLAECRERARVEISEGKPTNWVAAGFIIALWILMAALAVVLVLRATTT